MEIEDIIKGYYMKFSLGSREMTIESVLHKKVGSELVFRIGGGLI